MIGQGKVQHYLQMFHSLRSERSIWEQHWSDTARVISPAHRGKFFTTGRRYTKGEKGTQDMFDARGALALQRFQSVIESLATPFGQMWHRLIPEEDALRKDRAVMLYMEELVKILFRQRYRHHAGFVAQTQKTYNSYGAYGNGFLFTDADPDRGGLRYRNLFLGETYFLENHQGVPDGMFRTYSMKPRKIIQQFGKDGSIPDSVYKLAENPSTMNNEYEILHVILPTGEAYDPEALDARRMPWHSCYIFVQEQHVLSEGGYYSFPLSLCRYTQFSGEEYGRGPAQLVLPSIKLLNQQKKTVIKQGHRVVNPVLLSHDDGLIGSFSLKGGALNPGGVNADGRPLVHTLPTGNVAVGKDMMDEEVEIINDAFLITLFQILTENPRMTATEVLERTREKGMLIAPTAGRLQAEFLGPNIEREIEVLALQGMLPEPPPQLIEAGGVYSVEYDNPMSRMMKAEQASGFHRSLETTTKIASVTQDPSIFDHYNFDVAIPEMNEINGVPTSWTNPPDVIAQKREQRKQQQEQQMMIENAHGLAGAAKAMSDMDGEAAKR